jgi:pilus assembly protein Flp/PilA
MVALLQKFAKDGSGATAVEYGLICSLIVLAILSSLYLFQSSMGAMYSRIQTAITGTE